MKKLAWLSLVLVLVMSIAAVASASIYGGIEERIALAKANEGAHQIVGDQGGVFTASLNATQQIYYAYDWDMNFQNLSDAVGSGNAAISWNGTANTIWNP